MSRDPLLAHLVQIETMLHTSVHRVGRAVQNMRQEMGGYASTTPGSGSPGAGKNARATVQIRDPDDPVVHSQRVFDEPAPPPPKPARSRRHVDPVDVGSFSDRAQRMQGRASGEVATSVVKDGSFATPITSVEMQALGFGGLDRAALRLEALTAKAPELVRLLRVFSAGVGVEQHPSPVALVGPGRQVVLAYALTRRLVDASPLSPANHAWADDHLRTCKRAATAVFSMCVAWGYTPAEPDVVAPSPDDLAIDLTERWCTSHLRVGDRRSRDRGELCQWCRKFRDGEGFLPPPDLVRIHSDDGKVYDHQVAPFRQAHRDRMRNMVKR